MTIRQCPQCDLRFLSQSELELHRTLDHPSEGVPAQDQGHHEAGGGEGVNDSAGKTTLIRLTAPGDRRPAIPRQSAGGDGPLLTP